MMRMTSPMLWTSVRKYSSLRRREISPLSVIRSMASAACEASTDSDPCSAPRSASSPATISVPTSGCPATRSATINGLTRAISKSSSSVATAAGRSATRTNRCSPSDVDGPSWTLSVHGVRATACRLPVGSRRATAARTVSRTVSTSVADTRIAPASRSPRSRSVACRLVRTTPASRSSTSRKTRADSAAIAMLSWTVPRTSSITRTIGAMSADSDRMTIRVVVTSLSWTTRGSVRSRMDG